MRAFLVSLKPTREIIMIVHVYHGSAEDVRKLIPVTNDKKEVEPIYGCLDREKAILKGLEKLLEKTHKLKNLVNTNESLLIELEPTSSLLTRAMLEKMSVFLYTSIMSSKNSWVRIVEDGKLTDCVTTVKEVLPNDKAKIRINLWLGNKRVIIRHARF